MAGFEGSGLSGRRHSEMTDLKLKEASGAVRTHPLPSDRDGIIIDGVTEEVRGLRSARCPGSQQKGYRVCPVLHRTSRPCPRCPGEHIFVKHMNEPMSDLTGPPTTLMKAPRGREAEQRCRHMAGGQRNSSVGRQLGPLAKGLPNTIPPLPGTSKGGQRGRISLLRGKKSEGYF